MGYYVGTMNADFRIPAENLDKAYDALCALNARDELKTGGGGCEVRPAGSESVAGDPNRWFSWMPWNYDEMYSSVEEILNALGFETDVELNGDVTIVYYDNKMGAETHFLEALAPYVADGSYVEWRGEDNAMWRQDFNNGEMKERGGKIVWE